MELQKQIENITKIIARRSKAFRDPKVAFMTTAKQTAEAICYAGFRLQSVGEWVKNGDKYQCTQCKLLMDIDGTPTENLLHFCPNCGAKMKERES